ncbi:MAG: DUF2304 domain-containing protein [Clostridia bacterium]
MNTILQIILIIGTILFCIFILAVTKKKKLSFKYTLVWLIFGVMTLICAIFPSIVTGLSQLLHIEEPTNALFLIYIFLLIVIAFYISTSFSKLYEKVTGLIQENALLSYKIEQLEKEKKEKENENN